jgi:hypothetical protein
MASTAAWGDAKGEASGDASGDGVAGEELASERVAMPPVTSTKPAASNDRRE